MMTMQMMVAVHIVALVGLPHDQPYHTLSYDHFQLKKLQYDDHSIVVELLQ